ncbi:TGF_BETA_2 domain-containing protein [Nephila pilipes]|uniref:TGF_BETA_2 domain-containing protein n=1 Tax=Nephila pilipes TaxID=299642 RepID=A0A8X6NN52_NEPPI|nr:TGF_BETA_2 domain-containing protein [Nephila pilipes]
MATHPKIVFVLTVISSCLYCVFLNPVNDTDEIGGPHNVSYSHALYPRDKLIKDFQANFLKKLNLPNAPTDLPRVNFSSEVLQLLLDDTEERFNSRKVIRPSNSIYSCIDSNRLECSRFEFKLDSNVESVEKLHFWFHKKRPSQQLNFSVQFGNSTQVHHYYESSSDVEVQLNWARFHLKKSALEYVNETLQCTIEISGSYDLEDEKKLPMIVVTKRNEPIKRKKRSSNPKCDENCRCQSVDRTISFSEMSWDYWVLQPADLNIRACIGTCPYVQSSTNISYGSLMYNHEKYKPTSEDNGCNKFWVPRCYPDKMTSVKIIYIENETKTPIITDLKNMVVESCSCMSDTCFPHE